MELSAPSFCNAEPLLAFDSLLGSVIGDWINSLKNCASDPAAISFPTITNDPEAARSYPKGACEVRPRLLKSQPHCAVARRASSFVTSSSLLVAG